MQYGLYECGCVSSQVTKETTQLHNSNTFSTAYCTIMLHFMHDPQELDAQLMRFMINGVHSVYSNISRLDRANRTHPEGVGGREGLEFATGT